MENQHLDELIEKYILKTASIEEQQELLDWYHTQNNDEVAWGSDEINEEVLVKRRLLLNINERIQPKVKSISLLPKIAVTAAAVATITLGVWLYNISSTPRYPDHEVAAKQIFSGSDVAPGKNTAILTLANGKTIELSGAKTGVVIGKDKLAYDDGSLVGRNPELVLGCPPSHVIVLTASTPRGGTYQVTLPDGTRVWLNADSKISFPSQFSGKQRKILLSGEAYFEVYQNKRMPFIVESKGQQVEVLGTHFNITAYNDETSTKTTLLEGSVRVAFGSPSASHSSFTEGERSIVLKPNEQSTVSSNNQIKVNQVDANETIAWKNGDFVFKEETVESIMRKVARWYDVEVRYAPNAPKDIALGGVVSRSRNVSAVLKMMQLTNRVDFKIEGRTITVLPAKNNGPNQP